MEGFDINYWLTQSEQKPASEHNPTAADDFETVTRRIEEAAIDITGGYAQWRDIGFALAEGKGEAGRDLFHRISRFYPAYDHAEADRQYTACLSAHGTGIGPATFFQYAKQYGINISTVDRKFRNSVKSVDSAHSADTADPEYMTAPSFSQDIYSQLPRFLQKVACKADNEKEADILILGSMACISAVLPNYSGVYDDVTIYPNFCYYLTARASSGKGRQGLCRHLVKPIHDELLAEGRTLRAQYDADMIQFDKDRRDKRKTGVVKPPKPPQKMLIIPGDTSASAVLHRRGDDEHIEVNIPKLSTVLSGTPEQIKTLIRSPENGLFSRFAFYYLESNLEFKNVFRRSEGGSLNKYFEALGQQYLDFYHILQHAQPLEFSLTPEQEARFLDYFSESQTELFIDFGEGILATIRRMGVICYRLAMVLTALRIMETGDFYTDPVCTDEDFHSAMTISAALIRHSTKVFCELFGEKQRPRLSSTDEKRLFNALPADFGRQEYIRAARQLGINERTAEGYVAKFCGKMGLIQRLGYGKYHKIQ